MGSSRLPGKVLLDLAGETVLARVGHRLQRTLLVDHIVVATSTAEKDAPIVAACQQLRIACFRGSELDVLDRFYQCAKAQAADAVVRITADCPFIDPELVDTTIHAFAMEGCDYASNALEPTYPRGLDVEVFTMAALARCWREAGKMHQREHVTPYLYEHPELFHLLSLKTENDCSQHRWTLDTPEDLELLRMIYARLGNRNDFGWREVLRLMHLEPQLAQVNAHVVQKAVQA